jgi:hypothetical protein
MAEVNRLAAHQRATANDAPNSLSLAFLYCVVGDAFLTERPAQLEISHQKEARTSPSPLSLPTLPDNGLESARVGLEEVC